MEEEATVVNISVAWRGTRLNVEIPSNATLEDLGLQLHQLTNVRPDTLKLFIPSTDIKGSKLVHPFSAEHSKLMVNSYGNLEGKSLRMMGAVAEEIEELSENGKRADLRIMGFAEEENRIRQRILGGSASVVKLPKGNYIFSDFRTLQIPGIELNPPATEALKRMHMLASDPGIVAIMNKHRWRVGVMTEMAPVGYVGISPKCILGFNKNHGEEISLRLRTDDLKGFRKYESIKKTLIHELAHMVYSEHDENFFALDKQLNQEAVSLDWTKSRSRTLFEHRKSYDYEHAEEFNETQPRSYRLGGRSSAQPSDASAAAAQAAYNRLLSATAPISANGSTNVHIEEKGFGDPHVCDAQSGVSKKVEGCGSFHGFYDNIKNQEPDPDDSQGNEASDPEMDRYQISSKEPDPDDLEENVCSLQYGKIHDTVDCRAPNLVVDILQNDADSSLSVHSSGEPDPDDFLPRIQLQGNTNNASQTNVTINVDDNYEYIAGKLNASGEENGREKPGPGDLSEQDASSSLAMEIDQLGNMNIENENYLGQLNDDPELQRIQDPVYAICTRLEKAINVLKSESVRMEAASVLQTLLKILRNVIEHPEDTKFRRLRKGNPLIQKFVANSEAAMEILSAVGFTEDVSYDQMGRAETFLVLKRNDLGLLWLAKSSLEVSIA